MKLSCENFDRGVDSEARSLNEEESRKSEQHLEGCPHCQIQLEVHHALSAALASSPTLDFSDGFDAALSNRLAAAKPPRSLSSAARTLLTTYGVCAAGLSVWILSQIQWPSVVPMGSLGILLGLVALVTPFLLLHRWSPIAPTRAF